MSDTKTVDVRAVLEFAASDLAIAQGAFDAGNSMKGLDKASARLTEACAAIAELIEAANVLSDKSLQRTKLTASVYTSHVMRLRAALRAVGGA